MSEAVLESVTTGTDMSHDRAPTITTTELRRLLASGDPLWLIYLPTEATFSAGHIPGSLTTDDEELLAALPNETPIVFYGEGPHDRRAEALALRFDAAGRDARWYSGGLREWAAAGLPIERSPGRRQ